jgi:DNA primase
MEYQGIGYVEAVKELADSAGMKLPEFERASSAKRPGPDLFEIMQRASRYYREQLRASHLAIEYLKGRGLTGKIALRFGIGYAPAGWQSLREVYTDYDGPALKEPLDRRRGRPALDRFRDRIMFPILNQRVR